MWNDFLYRPLLNALIAFYHLSGNLGVAIIVMTITLRVALLPLTLPALKTAEKMKKLKPKLDELKKKHKDDKKKLAEAQMDLYKSAGVKPMAGFLPQIIQIVILIALFQAFRNVLGNGDTIVKLNELLYTPLKFSQDTVLNLKFLYLKLTEPDTIKIAGKNLPGVFLVLSAVGQFLSAKLMLPTAKKQEEKAKKTPEKKDDLASAMQTQSLYMFPAMTILFGYRFPAGLVLYWCTFSVFNLIQQLVMRKK